jgi:hypothetical protein
VGASGGVASLLLDGVEHVADADLDLTDDGQSHEVIVMLGG